MPASAYSRNPAQYALMFPALPTGIARISGAPPELVADLEGGRLLPVEAEGVDRVDQRDGMLVLLGQGPDDAQGVVEVALDRDDPRAGGEGLEQLAERGLAAWQHHDHLEPGRRAVGRRRRRGVPRRCTDDGLRALLDGLRHGHDHAAVLERSGRILALDLEGGGSGRRWRAEPLGADQRRRPSPRLKRGVASPIGRNRR